MSENIKPIETVYNGYRFRSRLEARWAVFFHEVGLDYQYEIEGYEMDGLRYLPDFYIPSTNRWFEIKGKPLSVKEIQKCEEFCRRKDNKGIKFSILIGAPQPAKMDFTDAVGILEYTWQWPSPIHPEGELIDCGDLVEEPYKSRFGLGIWIVPDVDSKTVLEAAKKAREARFEFGESPRS